MNRGPAAWLIAAAILAGVPRLVIAQVVHGKVVEDSTKQPIAAAEVSVIGSDGRTVSAVPSSPDGTFRLPIPPGDYHLRVQRIGYREWSSALFTAAPGSEVELQARLSPSPVELQPAEVVGEAPAARRALAEFERRREHETGHFITRDRFEKWTPRQLTDVLLRMPGLRVVRNPCFMMDATAPGQCHNPAIGGADTRRYVLRPRGGPISFGNANGKTGEDCGVLIYLDGRYVGDGLRVDLDFVPVDQVQAIEVYTGASQIPTELNRSGSACGVIVIWTR